MSITVGETSSDAAFSMIEGPISSGGTVSTVSVKLSRLGRMGEQLPIRFPPSTSNA